MTVGHGQARQLFDEARILGGAVVPCHFLRLVLGECDKEHLAPVRLHAVEQLLQRNAGGVEAGVPAHELAELVEQYQQAAYALLADTQLLRHPVHRIVQAGLAVEVGLDAGQGLYQLDADLIDAGLALLDLLAQQMKVGLAGGQEGIRLGDLLRPEARQEALGLGEPERGLHIPRRLVMAECGLELSEELVAKVYGCVAAQQQHQVGRAVTLEVPEGLDLGGGVVGVLEVFQQQLDLGRVGDLAEVVGDRESEVALAPPVGGLDQEAVL